MAPLPISSTRNPRVTQAIRLRDRRGREQQGRIIIDGEREIRLAIAGGVQLIELFFCRAISPSAELDSLLRKTAGGGADTIEVTEPVMQKLAFGERREGIVAVAKRPQRRLQDLKVASGSLIAVVEGVEKPGNLGAILRTADAAGVSAAIVADGRTDLYNPNAIRSSLGAIFTVPTCEATSEESLVWLRNQKLRLIAARVDGGVNYTEATFRGGTAIIFGSEAHGLTERWRGPDITAVRLPMLGQVDSLNLSVTAAVLLYEALRQRNL